jgi:hypothetical protein
MRDLPFVLLLRRIPRLWGTLQRILVIRRRRGARQLRAGNPLNTLVRKLWELTLRRCSRF